MVPHQTWEDMFGEEKSKEVLEGALLGISSTAS
jgi:hypothetical protein